MMYLANVWFGTSIGGLMDAEYIGQPWSWAKAKSVLDHLWIPVLVIGTGGTAGMIRKMRANLLDELQKQYVVTGRAKGLPPGKLLRKYPLRMALNFFISDIGSLLAERDLGCGDHRRRAVAADDRPDAAGRAEEPGHVSRRLVPHVPRVHDRHRRADLGPRARRAGSAHHG